MKQWSLDARRKASLSHSPTARQTKAEDWKAPPGLLARPGKSIATQSEGRAGEKYLPMGGRERKSCAVGNHPDCRLKRE
jgi:hypothetical protein